MNNLNVKAENRVLLNKKITRFYNDLIENLNYIICNRIKPINQSEFLNYNEICDFVDKYYINNKYRKQFNEEIERIKNVLNFQATMLSPSESDKIDRTFDDLINTYSDYFQTDFGKKIVELSKKDATQTNNFKQGTYNLLIEAVQKDFKAKNLPENYQISIKYSQISTTKQA